MWQYIVLLLLYRSGVTLSMSNGLKAQQIGLGKQYSCCKLEPYASHRDLPVIYCFPGISKGILKTFISVQVETSLDTDDYDLYKGYDSSEVLTNFESQHSSWTTGCLNWKTKHLHLNPFNSTCFGIHTDKDYVLNLNVSDVDMLFLGLFLLGILLFYFAPILSDNSLFYYVTAIIIGMSASVLVLLYFVIKMLPFKKPAMFGVMAGGAAAATFIMQFLSDNIYVLFNYKKYVAVYLSVSAMISFLVYYRFGPITDPRSKKIIRYSLQAAASIMIYYSSYFIEAMQITLVVMFIITNVPLSSWRNPLGKLWRTFRSCKYKYSKPKKLLTTKEFQKEAIEETEKAISELRTYCNSPEFAKNWQLVLGLQEQKKFAQFIKGKSHVSEQEAEQHLDSVRRLQFSSLMTDDSDEEY